MHPNVTYISIWSPLCRIQSVTFLYWFEALGYSRFNVLVQKKAPLREYISGRVIFETLYLSPERNEIFYKVPAVILSTRGLKSRRGFIKAFVLYIRTFLQNTIEK